jgi:ATP-dependent Lon protease
MSSDSGQFPSDIAWIDTLAGHQRDDGEDPPDQDPIPYPVLPLRSNIVFPRMVAPLIIGREQSMLTIEAAMQDDGMVLALAQRDPTEEEPESEDLFTIGTELKIIRFLHMPDGSTSVLAQGRQRMRMVELLEDQPILTALAIPLWEETESSLPAEALMRVVLSMFEKCVMLSPQLADEAYVAALNATDPGWLADLVASSLNMKLEDRQEILEILDPVVRLQEVSIYLGKELDMLELEDQIQAQVQRGLDRSQREYFLREQLRVIQAELGEMDEQTREVAELQSRIKAAQLTMLARQKAEGELRRLTGMPSFSPEISMVRTYLDWLIELPWEKATIDRMDVAHAAEVLSTNHYGLSRAKERILEHIAVRKLARDKTRTPLLCLVGPPGTGKTSMGRSVAQALGRKFVRVSLGGLRDEAEIRGHRRTYIGAMPGRVLQAIRSAGTRNPVLMLDEIDKMGQDFRGDPSAALLEVLDPEQNQEFMDHYLDVPYDLSQVLFIATANVLDSVPSPLLDRLEVIRFPGYVEDEKLEIARRFLVPRQIEQTGLESHGLAFTHDALLTIIRCYTYEAGLRDLERQLANVCRKVARRVAEGRSAPHRIMPGMLRRFLGPPKFSYGLAEEVDQVGVATGLAWTEAGGDLIQVEVTLMAGKGNVTLTGQLGEVMQESAQAALSYARSHAQELGIQIQDFDELDIHVHLPEGAIPKDGPSAGITMATALISALTNKPVRRDLAMTGEITLRGRVLAVGGLREKLIAAHRAGITDVAIPQKNVNDLVDMPRRVKRDIKVLPVRAMDEVLAMAFRDV